MDAPYHSMPMWAVATVLLAAMESRVAALRAPPRRRAAAFRVCAAPSRTFEVAWSATDGGTEDEKWIEFQERHYSSMVADERRTGLFLESLKRRLSAYAPGTATVLDLGTGPFALFARAAIGFGAGKVYALEAVPGAAERAALTVAGDAAIPDGAIEVIEGFSTAVSLPEKVDVLISEIAGSVASEEGVYATIADAQARFMKRPYDAASYVPYYAPGRKRGDSLRYLRTLAFLRSYVSPVSIRTSSA